MTVDRTYRILLRPVVEDAGVEWEAEIPELEGCVSYGATVEEALSSVKDAQEAWVHAAMEAGWEVPEAAHESGEYSGKFTVRVPKSLHRHLANMACLEGVSLNQYVLHLLSRGRHSPAATTDDFQTFERTRTTETIKGHWERGSGYLTNAYRNRAVFADDAHSWGGKEVFGRWPTSGWQGAD